MLKNSTRIKINVIWDKTSNDGEILAEIIYRYFCSSELSILPDNIFSIPVRCYPVENYSKSFNCIMNQINIQSSEMLANRHEPMRFYVNSDCYSVPQMMWRDLPKRQFLHHIVW